MNKILTKEKLFQLLKQVVTQADHIVPGESEDAKKKWVAKRLLELVEVFDNHIPVIGIVMDIPVVDEIEGNIVDQFVGWAWDRIEGELQSVQA